MEPDVAEHAAEDHADRQIRYGHAVIDESIHNNGDDDDHHAEDGYDGLQLPCVIALLDGKEEEISEQYRADDVAGVAERSALKRVIFRDEKSQFREGGGKVDQRIDADESPRDVEDALFIIEEIKEHDDDDRTNDIPVDTDQFSPGYRLTGMP